MYYGFFSVLFIALIWVIYMVYVVGPRQIKKQKEKKESRIAKLKNKYKWFNEDDYYFLNNDDLERIDKKIKKTNRIKKQNRRNNKWRK